jgi:hypothetical protein
LSSGAAIDFTNQTYTADMHASAYLPVSNQATAQITLTNTVPANSTHPLFLALSIEFLQDVNGVKYGLKNGSYNALAFVKILGV